MPDPLISALGRTRVRLNALIALHRALAWAAPSAIAAGILVASARALGMAAAGFPLWSGLALTGAAAGAFASRKAFMSEGAAARWLDSRLGDEELLSAAIACARRGREGPFDSAIAEKAEELLPRAVALKAPRGPMAGRAGIAAICFLAGAYLIFLAGGTAALAKAKVRAEGERGSAERASSIASAREGSGPSAFASALFPGDRRMAKLTERALREGRLDDLRDLLKAAGLDIDAKLAGSPTESERKKLAQDRERIGDAAKAMAMAARASGGGAGGNPSGGSEEGGDRAPGSQGVSPNADSRASLSAASSELRSPAGPEGGGEGKGASGAGAAGRGSGSGPEGDWGAIKPTAGKGSLAIAAPKDPAFFELVLPGSEAAAPISGLAPSSRKSAEAAMAREGLPLEYEDFVRSYFLSLSKGDSR